MAYFVIAGVANCPFYTKIELLADKLCSNVPEFRVHKIIKPPEEWHKWLDELCNINSWTHSKSPIVWRELLGRGSKGSYLGGFNEFMEYVQAYYNVTSHLNTSTMEELAEENLSSLEDVFEEKYFMGQVLTSSIYCICVTNAVHYLSYHFLLVFLQAPIVAEHSHISLRLLVTPDRSIEAKYLKTEIESMALNNMHEIIIAFDLETAFKNCHMIILLDEKLKEHNESEEKWLQKNAKLFENYAEIIKTVAKPNVYIIFAPFGPVNLNATIFARKLWGKIKLEHIVVVSQVKEFQAKSLLAERLRVHPSQVSDVIIWGGAYNNCFVDWNLAQVRNYEGAIWGPPGYTRPIVDLVFDKEWLEMQFCQLINERSDIINSLQRRQATLLIVHSIIQTLKCLFYGSPKGQMISLGVVSQGWYGVPEGLVFSFPVTAEFGNFKVVEDLNLGSDVKTEIQKATEEVTSGQLLIEMDNI